MKVLSGYLILLSFYVINAATITDKITSAPATSKPGNPSFEYPQLFGGFVKRIWEYGQIAVGNQKSIAVTTPTTTVIPVKTVRKSVPPKKYIPPTNKPSTNGPLKISLSKSPVKTTAPPKKRVELICPKEDEATFELFAPPCKTDGECMKWNKQERCCKLFGSRNCIKGVPKPLEEEVHAPLLGLIPRKCPTRPLAELWWDLKTCETDNDCWPRICCPDGQRKYCRASTAKNEAVPTPIGRPLAYLSEYLECTPPPPPIFDLHPKECNSTLDCFPNVCCQESGQKRCRPPKKSVLTLMANFFNIGLVQRLTRNIVIK